MPPNPNLARLHRAGVSIWLDTLSRQLLESGEFSELIRDCSVTGATSNPTIFAKAITGSDLYGEQLRRLAPVEGHDPQELFFELALDDVRAAARELRPAYDASEGHDGFVSFECTPDLADDTEATIAQATELWQRLSQPNAMIKVPATRAGLPAIEELTRRGISVNVTLLFALDGYEQVLEAYLRGLSARAEAGESLDGIASAASFFLSRIDTKVDAQLAEDSPLRGRVAIASARVAYQRYLAKFSGHEWERLRDLGARPAATLGEHRDQGQRLLRRPLRRGADRSRRDQHDARADASRLRRSRRCRRDPPRRPGRSRTAAQRRRAGRRGPSSRHHRTRA